MKVVQCHGCFDLLHIGHIRHLQAARAAGDRLVVTVTPDRFVNKGPGRPVFSAALRMEALRALDCVDDVQMTDAPTAADAIRAIRPAVFAKGPDYSPVNLDPGERDALAEVGGQLLITTTQKWSSTALLRTTDRPPALEQYLVGLRSRYTVADVRHWLTRARSLSVLVIGEAILDDYHYCQTLGKAGKEPILAAQFVRSEQFIGGAEAVASHARACSDEVRCVTGPVVTKRRFIETYPFQKLFEVYEMDEFGAALDGDFLARTIGPNLRSADLVIVADYGHGFLTQALIESIETESRFLAVNTQANAGNHGFNTISKYGTTCRFVSLSERELRLDMRDQSTSIQALMAKQPYATTLVTRGAHGCMAMAGGRISEAPAFATHAVDRVGAGDAVFAVAACCAAVGMPLDLLTFVAAVVGTLAVGIVGNARYIERDALDQAIAEWFR